MPRKTKTKNPAATAGAGLSVEKPPSIGGAARVKAGKGTLIDQANLATHVACALVKAMENFVLPIIIQTCGLSVGKELEATTQDIQEDVDNSHLSREAQGVLIALEKFISSLVSRSPDRAEDGVTESKGGATVPEEKLNLVAKHGTKISSSITPVSKIRALPASEDPQLLKAALEQAHHHVFNKMPIRLLTFNPDGSAMELIERSAVWDRVSAAVRSNIEDLKRSMYPVHDVNPGKRAIDDFISKHAQYAILSHTWLQGTPGEVTYTNWKSRNFDAASPGYQKLANFCKVAAVDHGVTLGWMDTICINKESSSELDESIRSMFKWYCDASVCVTYLAQTTTVRQMHTDPWFTRGWTLQELLAPRHTKFYGANWAKISNDLGYDTNNQLILKEIQAATTITQSELNSFQESRDHLRISRRMQWAADRRVTREEDTAYSLMGIFDVSISIAYGEGSEWAFFRLVSEILASARRDVLDIVNWCARPGSKLEPSTSSVHASSLIPSSPKQYLWRAKEDIDWFPLVTPIALTHVGLRLQVLLMTAIAADPNFPDAEFYPIGSYSATVNIDAEDPIDPTKRLPQTYNVLDMKTQNIRNDWMTPTTTRMFFGVLNFGETDTTITLPSSPCLALCLYTQSNSPVNLVETSNIRKIETPSVIVFDFIRSPYFTQYEIEKDSLGRQGMMLYTLYL